MAEDAIRTGTVASIEQKAKGPWKAKVGGRIVNFWPNEFDNPNQPTAIREFLEGAVISGLAVEVSGTEEDFQTPDGVWKKTFKAQGVRILPEGSQPPPNGSQTPSQTRSEPPGDKKYVGREPGEADYWLAMRWAYSTAIDLLSRGDEPPSVDEISKLAGELFFRSRIEALQAKEKASE